MLLQRDTIVLCADPELKTVLSQPIALHGTGKALAGSAR